MSVILVPDTSSLIAFSRLGLLAFFSSQYDQVLITPGIRREFFEALPDAFENRMPRNELL